MPHATNRSSAARASSTSWVPACPSCTRPVETDFRLWGSDVAPVMAPSVSGKGFTCQACATSGEVGPGTVWRATGVRVDPRG